MEKERKLLTILKNHDDHRLLNREKKKQATMKQFNSTINELREREQQ